MRVPEDLVGPTLYEPSGEGLTTGNGMNLEEHLQAIALSHIDGDDRGQAMTKDPMLEEAIAQPGSRQQALNEAAGLESQPLEHEGEADQPDEPPQQGPSEATFGHRPSIAQALEPASDPSLQQHGVASSGQEEPPAPSPATIYLQSVITAVPPPATTIVPTSTPPARTKRQPPSTPLRRSRRLAMAGTAGRFVQKAQAVLMKKLGLSPEPNGISAETMEAYAKLFDHPLSSSHVAALAALFS